MHEFEATIKLISRNDASIDVVDRWPVCAIIVLRNCKAMSSEVHAGIIFLDALPRFIHVSVRLNRFSR